MADLSKIRILAQAKGMTLKVLAKNLNISDPGLQRILRTNSTKIETLEKIAKELEVPIESFFRIGHQTDDFALDNIQNRQELESENNTLKKRIGELDELVALLREKIELYISVYGDYHLALVLKSSKEYREKHGRIEKDE